MNALNVLLMNLHSPWQTETLPKMLSKRIMKCEKKEIIDANAAKILIDNWFNQNVDTL